MVGCWCCHQHVVWHVSDQTQHAEHITSMLSKGCTDSGCAWYPDLETRVWSDQSDNNDPPAMYKDPMSLFMQFQNEFRSAFRFQVLYIHTGHPSLAQSISLFDRIVLSRSTRCRIVGRPCGQFHGCSIIPIWRTTCYGKSSQYQI